MDVYHIVLAKLCEITEGRDTKIVDFRELVKNAGYLGNYTDIFEKLSSEGWIVEDKKENFVKITHWGVSETRKTEKVGLKNISQLTVDANRAKAEASEFEKLLDELSKDISVDSLTKCEKKLAEIKELLSKIKSSL